MKSRTVSTTYGWLSLILIILILIGIAGWVNLQIAGQLPVDSDFKDKWEATQALIFDGRNPYEDNGEKAFTAPLPVVLFYAPFALVEDYEIARAAWMTALQATTFMFAILCIRIVSWQIRGLGRHIPGIFG